MMDLACILDNEWLRASLDSAVRQRKANLVWISRALSHRQGHPGVRRLRALLREYSKDGEVSDSVLESLGYELARATGRKPKLHWNVRDGLRFVAEVDLAWPEVRLCVEFDGWMHHGTRTAFMADRARDRALCGLGWMVLRYTWQDVRYNPEKVIIELARTYENRVEIFSGRRLHSV